MFNSFRFQSLIPPLQIKRSQSPTGIPPGCYFLKMETGFSNLISPGLQSGAYGVKNGSNQYFDGVSVNRKS